MTFREKLKQEHPECIDSIQDCICAGCPAEYGYEPEFECGVLPCEECWDREIPVTTDEEEQHGLKINAEIIRWYCDQHKTKPCNQCPAYDPCFEISGNAFAASANKYNPEKQRAMLDAFKAALPPKEEEAPTAPHEIPLAVRKLVAAEVRRLAEAVTGLSEQIKVLEAERDTLCDYLQGANNGDT